MAAKKPNILILWGDDIGIWNISHFSRGMMGYRTPNIDRIAKEGVTFTDYYSQQSCTAGRACFICGQNPIRTGLTKVGMPGATVGLQKEDPTIAEVVLAELAGGIALRLEQFGDGRIFLLQADRRAGHPDLGQARADGVLAADEARTTGGTALLRIVVGECHAFLCNAIDIRRLIAHHAATEMADIPHADVVTPQNQDVRFLCCHERIPFSSGNGRVPARNAGRKCGPTYLRIACTGGSYGSNSPMHGFSKLRLFVCITSFIAASKGCSRKQNARDRHDDCHDQGRTRAAENSLLIEHPERLPIFEGPHHHRESSHRGQKKPGIAWNIAPDELTFLLKCLEDLENCEAKTQ